MKPSHLVCQLSDSKAKSCLCSLFLTASLICGVYFTGSALLAKDYRISLGLRTNATQLNTPSVDCQVLPKLNANENDTKEDTQTNKYKVLPKLNAKENDTKKETQTNQYKVLPKLKAKENDTKEDTQSNKCEVLPKLKEKANDTKEDKQSNKCKEKCRPVGSETLPEGIVVKMSNLEMSPLSGPVAKNRKPKHSRNLLALAVGIKQKELVNQIVKKFLDDGFVVMLFHYDNVMDEWNDLEWSSHVIHVSAANQTKWWFAKRFLHPDIVAEYDYIFLWDEDLQIENFHPARYLSIVRKEGLEISQPALDSAKSEVHHQITARQRRSTVHRWYYKSRGSPKCDEHSTGPPCAGWIEMMAPVFSRAAWRCVWYMIQNDLIHAWGLDMQLGYCAQGDRAIKVGVVDAEYIVHMGLPTLGGLSGERKLSGVAADHPSRKEKTSDSEPLQTHMLYKFDNRYEVRKRSYLEMKIFRNRWNNAVKEDQCFIDPYQQAEQKKKISEHR